MIDSRTTRRRAEQVAATREALVAAGERLFAEQGVHAVSTRQISEAAGQGNNAAVNYHFGGKVELLRAILARRAEQVEAIRARMVQAAAGSTDVRDWVGCAVNSITQHLDALGSPGWYARLVAQVTTDPALHEIAAEEYLAYGPSTAIVRANIEACFPDLSPDVRRMRSEMTRHLITQVCVDRERALSESPATVGGSWGQTAGYLVDAIEALWNAPDRSHDRIPSKRG